MEPWLNYHHLLYFWTVAREGSLRAAAERLRLAPSTVSAQVRRLEEVLGLTLFRRVGRGLVLTDEGRAVQRYADEIFDLGEQLLDFASGRQPGMPLNLEVGVTMVIPKLLAHKLIEPALTIGRDGPDGRKGREVYLRMREDTVERLLGQLALHQLDVVLTDGPVGAAASVKVFDHLLGRCGVQFFATPDLVERYSEGFPKSLEGAPMLMPTGDHLVRRQLDRWFYERDIHPRFVGEFQDSALLKVFGQRGLGIFPAPDLIADEVIRQYEVAPLGPAPGVTERFYAVTVARRIRHPGVVALREAALDAHD